MAPRKKKPILPRPLDANQEAFRFVHGILGEPVAEEEIDKEAIREMAQKGGKKGGVARAQALTAAQRRSIAKRAAKTRWDKDSTEP